MAFCDRHPPSPVGRELLETGVIGKPKVNSLSPGLGPGGAVPASVLTQSAGLRVGAGGGGHRAELGSARVTGVLTAGSRLRSENRADGNALPPSVPPPPSLEWKATGTALSFEQEQMLYPHFTAERRGCLLIPVRDQGPAGEGPLDLSPRAFDPTLLPPYSTVPHRQQPGQKQKSGVPERPGCQAARGEQAQLLPTPSRPARSLPHARPSSR